VVPTAVTDLKEVREMSKFDLLLEVIFERPESASVLLGDDIEARHEELVKFLESQDVEQEKWEAVLDAFDTVVDEALGPEGLEAIEHLAAQLDIEVATPLQLDRKVAAPL
jgi:hypothetical protein